MVRLLVEEVLVDSVNEKLTVKHVIPLDKSFPLRSGSSSSEAGALSPRDHLFSALQGRERATAAVKASSHAHAAWRRTQKPRRVR